MQNRVKLATITPDLNGKGTASSGISHPEKAQYSKTPNKHAVLIVDDEKSVLKALKRVFVDEGHKIITAENAADGLSAMVTNNVNLVISDHQMPGMSGIEFLKIVRDRHPNTIRIMLTGVSGTDVVMGAVKDGAVYKFINKPWNDDDLRLTVKLALSQYDLIQENTRLKSAAKKQLGEIHKLKRFVGADHSTLRDILIAKGLIMPGQLEMVTKYCDQKKTILVKALIELGMIEEQELIKIIQNESKVDVVVLNEEELNKNLSKLLPREVCETGCLVPVRLEDNNLYLAMADPLDLDRVDYIGFTTRRNVTTLLARLSDIEKAIKHIYDGSGTEVIKTPDEIDYPSQSNEIDILLDEEEIETAEQLMAKSSTPPAIRMVNAIMTEAVKTGASDIHIEPKPTYTLIRYRIDGLLHSRIKIPSSLHLTTISRLKILAKMDIAERRIPQDGRITVKTDEKFIDIRVSSMPTINGEKIVCRLLDKSASIWSLDKIGVCGKSLTRLKSVINIPQGMVIATGPTGSGKTTSLYAMMRERQSTSLNFVTIEDPVEYLMENAAQVLIHEKIGLTFASTLRSALRQDPDVILVGEIRDLETAMAAFQASMTGHLVFTTLHTNSTIATISRLFHLGVEPFLVASSVNGIFAQRLVRKICPECKELGSYDRKLLTALGVSNDNIPEKLYFGKGCENCDNTGYKGRIGLFEVFQMNEEFRQFLTTNYHETELMNMAKSLGMETLLDDGLKKVVDGETTLDEILRVLGPTTELDYYCDSCNSKLDIRFSTCPYCGSMQKKICQNCRARLNADWKACPYCGNKDAM